MKKISVKTVKAFMDGMVNDGVEEVVRSVGDISITIHLKTKLTLQEKGQFVRRVVNACFDQDGGFYPQYFIPVFRATLIQMCTDLPVLSIRGEGGDLLDVDGMNSLYDALGFNELEDRPAVNTMKNELATLCDEAVEYEKNRMISAVRSASDDVLTEISGAMRAIRDAASAIAKQANGVDTEKLLEYAGKLSYATEGLTPDHIVEEIANRITDARPAGNVIQFPGNDSQV